MDRLRQAQIELRSHTELAPSDDETANHLRTWNVSVQTLMCGKPVSLESVATCISVDCPPGDVLDVEYLGQLDSCTAIYRLEEKVPISDNVLKEQVKIKLVPRYSESVFNYFKLNDLLTSVVGRRYLQAPKFSITMVLSYARDRKLLDEKFMICDSFLSQLFNGVKFIKLSSLWHEIKKLLIPADPVNLLSNLQLQTTEEPSQVTESKLHIKFDCDSSEIFPGDWPTFKGPGGLRRSRSARCIRSVKMPKNARTLRRHKTL